METGELGWGPLEDSWGKLKDGLITAETLGKGKLTEGITTWKAIRLLQLIMEKACNNSYKKLP